MPKYKEIVINVQLTPEMILGEILKNSAPVNAKESIESGTENKKE